MGRQDQKKIYRFREKRSDIIKTDGTIGIFWYYGYLVEETNTHFIVNDIKVNREFRLLKTDTTMEEVKE